MRWMNSTLVLLLLSFSAQAMTFKTVESDINSEDPLQWSDAATWVDNFKPPSKLKEGDLVIIASSVILQEAIDLNGAKLQIDGHLTLTDASLISGKKAHFEVSGVLTVLQGAISSEALELGTEGQYEIWSGDSWSDSDPHTRTYDKADADIFIYPNPSKSGSDIYIGGHMLSLESGDQRFSIVNASDGSLIATGILGNDDTRVPVEGIMPPGAYLFLIDGYQKVIHFTVAAY